MTRASSISVNREIRRLCQRFSWCKHSTLWASRLNSCDSMRGPIGSKSSRSFKTFNCGQTLCSVERHQCFCLRDSKNKDVLAVSLQMSSERFTLVDLFHDTHGEIRKHLEPCDCVSLSRTCHGLRASYNGSFWPFAANWLSRERAAQFVAKRPKWASRVLSDLVRCNFHHRRRPFTVGIMGSRFVIRWPWTVHGKWARGPNRGFRHSCSIVIYPRLTPIRDFYPSRYNEGKSDETSEPTPPPSSVPLPLCYEVRRRSEIRDSYQRSNPPCIARYWSLRELIEACPVLDESDSEEDV